METFLVAVGAVALLIIGLSITLIRKGHHIEGDVGDNRNMQALGLKCTIEEMGGGEKCPSSDGGCCAHCEIDCK